MSAGQTTEGQRVTYHHTMLNENIAARVLSVSKRGIIIEFDDVEHGWPRDRRFLTHWQASEALSPIEVPAALFGTGDPIDDLSQWETDGGAVPEQVAASILIESAPRMTYRERREAKAERLREWAGKREERSEAASRAAHDATAGIPFGQPIISGHHSERRHRNAIERGDRAIRSAVENGRTAERMASTADEIERQAANAIYSDDPDAIEQLTAKIERLEAERARIKAYNASCRKAAKAGDKIGDLSLLDAKQKESLLTTARVCAYQLGKGGSFPAYELQYASANIKRARDRIAAIQREAVQGPRDRLIVSRYTGECADCGAKIEKGQSIRYNRQQGARCGECPEGA